MSMLAPLARVDAIHSSNSQGLGIDGSNPRRTLNIKSRSCLRRASNYESVIGPVSCLLLLFCFSSGEYKEKRNAPRPNTLPYLTTQIAGD